LEPDALERVLSCHGGSPLWNAISLAVAAVVHRACRDTALPVMPGLENSDIVPKDNSVIAPGTAGPTARALHEILK
jgi:hypothetical protein